MFLYLMFLFIALTALYVMIIGKKDSGKEIEKNITDELELRGMYTR